VTPCLMTTLIEFSNLKFNPNMIANLNIKI
jgi:hypothetical protein